jgi:hypothetical protein
MVIGSGVYRIGSSVEFDWCAVRSIQVDVESVLLSIACFFRQNFETDKRKPAEPVSESCARQKAGNKGFATLLGFGPPSMYSIKVYVPTLELGPSPTPSPESECTGGGWGGH